MNKHYILIIVIILCCMAFIHYELSLERDNRLILFCESQQAKDQVDAYGPTCYHFMKTSF